MLGMQYMLRCWLFFFKKKTFIILLLGGESVNSCSSYFRQFPCENCKSVLVDLLFQECVMEAPVCFVIHCITSRAGLSDGPQL